MSVYSLNKDFMYSSKKTGFPRGMGTRIIGKLRQPCYHVSIHFPGFTNYSFEIIIFFTLMLDESALFINKTIRLKSIST